MNSAGYQVIAGTFRRKQIDELADLVREFGAKGLAWLALGDEGEVRSSFAKFLS
ncbi:MAG: hypothetical protein P8186_18430, partial [Anaerolineae bacterium]